MAAAGVRIPPVRAALGADPAQTAARAGVVTGTRARVGPGPRRATAVRPGAMTAVATPDTTRVAETTAPESTPSARSTTEGAARAAATTPARTTAAVANRATTVDRRPRAATAQAVRAPAPMRGPITRPPRLRRPPLSSDRGWGRVSNERPRALRAVILDVPGCSVSNDRPSARSPAESGPSGERGISNELSEVTRAARRLGSRDRGPAARRPPGRRGGARPKPRPDSRSMGDTPPP